jgi:two-component system chemotaxis sensor kinase CheA
MAETDELTCEEFLAAARLPAARALRGAELEKLFWKFKGIEKEVERQKAFWASTNETLEQVYRELEANTRKVQSILEHIQQGVGLFDATLTLLPGYSRFLQELLTPFAGGASLEGIALEKVLLEPSELDADQRARVRESLRSILGADELAFELNRGSLPSEMRMGEDRFWELDWVPMQNAEGIVDRMMICLRDVTEIRKVRFQAEAQKRELDKIAQLLQLHPESWNRFVVGARAALKAARTDLLERLWEAGANPSLTPVVADMLVHLHSLKGNSRSLGLLHLSQEVHRAEQIYAEYRHDPTRVAWTVAGLHADLDRVEATLASYEDIVQNRLRRFGELIADRPRDDVVPLAMLLAPVFDTLPSIAEQLGKIVPTCTLTGAKVGVTSAFVGALESSLAHLARNCVDHGLLPGVAGRIEFDVRDQGAGSAWRWELSCRDSGRGLNLARLRRDAARAAVDPRAAVEVRSDESVAQRIFLSGVSTAERVTDISGRGVGLNAVRRLIEAQGGRVRVEFTAPAAVGADAGFRPFRLLLELPESAFVLVK